MDDSSNRISWTFLLIAFYCIMTHSISMHRLGFVRFEYGPKLWPICKSIPSSILVENKHTSLFHSMNVSITNYFWSISQDPLQQQSISRDPLEIFKVVIFRTFDEKFDHHVRQEEHVGAPSVDDLAGVLVQGQDGVLGNWLLHVLGVHVIAEM